MVNPAILIPIVIITVLFIKRNKEYKSSAYYHITKLPYHSVKHNKGRYGEYLIYQNLKCFETDGAKFLFNIYLPKGNGETTEIDILMICSKGIFIFESKNYSGWIFGNEEQKNWCQTLPKGRGQSHKEYFYNPIMQNRSHIKHLQTFLGEQVPIYSVIVFSDRCTLKSIEIKNSEISVINRCNVVHVILFICTKIHTDLLSESDITSLYNKLYPYTQVDSIVKMQHITNIHNNLNTSTESSQQTTPTISSLIQTEVTPTPFVEQSQTADKKTSENTTGVVHSVVLEPHQAEQNNKLHVLNCPICNGYLVLRTATKGKNAGSQFYGCSNYPKCKYTKNVERF